MILQKIKHYYLQKKIARLLAVIANEKIHSREKINSVGILIQSEFLNANQIQDLVVKKLNVKTSKVYRYRRLVKNKEKSDTDFSNKDFNWKGDIRNQNLLSFVKEPTDLLICLCSERNPYLEYLILQSNAGFRVGFAGVNPELYDLEISVNKSQLEVFLDEIKKYLTILGKL